MREMVVINNKYYIKNASSNPSMALANKGADIDAKCS
jgi:hypothetical protein